MTKVCACSFSMSYGFLFNFKKKKTILNMHCEKIAIFCWAFICWVTFDRKSSQIMRFHGLNDEAQLLVNKVTSGNLTVHVFLAKDSSRSTPCEGRIHVDQMSAQINGIFSTSHRTRLKITSIDDDCYIPGDWRARGKSTISRWVLLDYEIILNCLLKRYNERVAACGALCESPPELWRRLPWWIH